MKLLTQLLGILLTMMFIFLGSVSGFAKKKGYFELHEKGWHWYKAIPELEKGEDEKVDNGNRDYPKNPLDELKSYQRRLEEAKALAVMHPNKENIEKYQYLQYEVLDRANKFSKIWMENVYKNPELNYSLKSPTSQKARYIFVREEEKKKIRKITNLSKEYGLFYFFKNGCEYCTEFAFIVKSFSEKYSWKVLAISEFGEVNELFERNVKDNGLAETWGVTTYPSLFAVNPKTGDVIPIANGMISIEEMEDRIMTITKEDCDKDEEDDE